MFAVVTLLTDEVVIVNVAVVLPAVTVVVAGTTAEVLLLLSETTAPPVGAGLFSVTVPVELAPATTLVGLTLTAVRFATGVMVSAACTLVDAYVAVMVAVVVVVTAVVLMVKVPDDDPLGMVRLVTLGTAEELLLPIVTVMPALGAGAVRVTVPVDDVPPVTEVGLTATEDNAALVDEGVNTRSTQ